MDGKGGGSRGYSPKPISSVVLLCRSPREFTGKCPQAGAARVVLKCDLLMYLPQGRFPPLLTFLKRKKSVAKLWCGKLLLIWLPPSLIAAG